MKVLLKFGVQLARMLKSGGYSWYKNHLEKGAQAWVKIMLSLFQ